MMVAEVQPKHLKQEVEPAAVAAQLPRVAAVYDGVEHGRRPSIFMQGRGEITRAIRAARDQELSGLDVLSAVGEFYPVADVEAYLREHRRNRRLVKAAVAGLMLFGATTMQAETKEVTESALADESVVVETNTSDDKTSQSSTTNPATTTTASTVPATNVPITTAPLQAVPVAVTEMPTTTTQPFDQRHFGPVSSIVVDEAFSLEVKQIAQQTKDVDASNRPELYEYVDTLAAFNGIDKDNVQAGQRISYHDCPDNGAVIRAGDTAGTFAARNGISESEVHSMNNGTLQTVAGWCGRIAME